jgi:hypothetical protein
MENKPKPIKGKKVEYKKGEREEMLKNCFPICYLNNHCRTCIKMFRQKQELDFLPNKRK